MVLGIERFREWFRGYEDHYAIIGGTACDLLMAEEGLDFRGTKDIDLVLIVEAISPEFGRRFWEFVRNAGYEHCNKSTGQPQFYRFTHPKASEYPFMIELFSRKVDAIELPEEAVLTPLPMDEDVSSLSAILLDEDYYQLLRSGTSIGANTKESVFAQSKADFIAKLFIAQKECAETEYWLELLHESDYINKQEFDSIYEDCQELMRLLVATTKTLQGKQ